MLTGIPGLQLLAARCAVARRHSSALVDDPNPELHRLRSDCHPAAAAAQGDVSCYNIAHTQVTQLGQTHRKELCSSSIVEPFT